LVLALTLNETGFGQYWNKQSEELNSKLWSPTKTDLLEQVSSLSNGLLNNQGVKSYVWKKQLVNQNLITTNLYHSSLLSATRITEKEVTVTKKIRIYPTDIPKWLELCNLDRAVYNHMVERLNNWKSNTTKPNAHKNDVTNITKKWNNYVNHVVNESCMRAISTNSIIIKKRSRGEKCELNFKSRKEPVQGFSIQRLGKSIYPKFLGKENVYISERIPEDSFGRTARVIVENNRWYLCTKTTSIIKPHIDVEKQAKICAIDPGVRTFATLYSPELVIKYGNMFKDRIYPLAIQLDKYYSRKSKLNNKKSDKQWYKDRLSYLTEKIYKLRNRIKDLVCDLHDKVAYDIVNKFDIILLPTFEVKDMTQNTNRKINTRTVRNMLQLAHYRFKCRIKWFAKKYGKFVIDVGESYTSKTNSMTGDIMDIRTSDQFIYDGEIYDRDINGARGIFLKNLKIRQDQPLTST